MTTRFSPCHVGLAILVVMVTVSVAITSGEVIPGPIATGYLTPTTATIATGYLTPTTTEIATGYP